MFDYIVGLRGIFFSARMEYLILLHAVNVTLPLIINLNIARLRNNIYTFSIRRDDLEHTNRLNCSAITAFSFIGRVDFSTTIEISGIVRMALIKGGRGYL